MTARDDRSDSAVARLWDEFHASPSPSTRESLILHFAPLVKYVAGRLAVGLPRSVEQSDLVSYGMFGLIDAVDKFEPCRGARFETYAIFRIRGAILDELRAIDWVPRRVRARARQIEEAFARLEGELHRSPTDAELAIELGWTDADLGSVLAEIATTGLTALDELVSGEMGEPTAVLEAIASDRPGGGNESYEAVDTRHLIGEAVAGLPERERLVLSLYYFEGLTLAEIGRVIGVTESRVSQIHAKAVLHLRSRLAPSADELR